MSAKDIRNIVLLGHSGSGKTTLAESMLYLTGGTDRLGRIADGNTVCDYDPEEIRRQISISLAVAPVEYDSCKINVLDVPGGFDFAGEVAEAVQAADAGTRNDLGPPAQLGQGTPHTHLIAAAGTAACQHQRLLRGFSAFHIKPSRARSRYFLKLL